MTSTPTPRHDARLISRRTWRNLAASLAATLLTLSGCAVGGGSDSDDLKLMLIVNLDTPAANQPSAIAGATAAARALGEINGQKVDIEVCNQQNDANVAASCARKAVSEKAAAVVAYASNQGDIIDPILEQGKIPSIGIAPITSQDLKSPISFPILAGNANSLAGVGVTYADMGYTKIGMAILDSPLADSLSDYITNIVEKAKTPDGSPVEVIEVKVPQTAADFTPYVSQLNSKGAQGVILATSTAAGGALTLAAKKLGYDMTFGSIAMSYTRAEPLNALGEAANGFISVDSLPDPTVANPPAGIQEFLDDMAAAKKAGVDNTGEEFLNVQALNGWLSVQAVAEVAEGIDGAVTNQNLLDALNDAKDLELKGLVPPWTPSNQGPDSAPRVTNGFVYATKFENGVYTLVQPDPVDLYSLDG